MDAAAATAVGRVARNDLPLLSVPLALSDHVTGKSYLLRVPVGTPVAHLLKAAELGGQAVELRTGDVLQQLIAPAGAVISPADLYLHVLPAAELAPPDPCIRCGWCVEACPTKVQPAAAFEAAQLRSLMAATPAEGPKAVRKAEAMKHKVDAMAEKAGVAACIECGLCQYVCPSRLPLLKALRQFTRVGRPG
jgi:electron transport complex protein RnfC